MRKLNSKIVQRFINDVRYSFPIRPKSEKECNQIKAHVDNILDGKNINYSGKIPRLLVLKKPHRITKIMIASVVIISCIIGGGAIAYKQNIIEFHQGMVIINFSDSTDTNNKIQNYIGVENTLIKNGIKPVCLPQIFKQCASTEVNLSKTDVSKIAHFTVNLQLDNKMVSIICNLEMFSDKALMDSYIILGAEEFETLVQNETDIYIMTAKLNQTDIRYCRGNIIYNLKVCAEVEVAKKIALTI